MVAFEVAQTSKAAEKLPNTIYIHMYLSIEDIFVLRYFKFNKDVILNTEIIFALSGLVLFVILHMNFLPTRTKNGLPVPNLRKPWVLALRNAEMEKFGECKLPCNQKGAITYCNGYS